MCCRNFSPPHKCMCRNNGKKAKQLRIIAVRSIGDESVAIFRIGCREWRPFWRRKIVGHRTHWCCYVNLLSGGRWNRYDFYEHPLPSSFAAGLFRERKIEEGKRRWRRHSHRLRVSGRFLFSATTATPWFGVRDKMAICLTVFSLVKFSRKSI